MPYAVVYWFFSKQSAMPHLGSIRNPQLKMGIDDTGFNWTEAVNCSHKRCKLEEQKKQYHMWECNPWWSSFTVMGRNGTKLR